jgi:hypothetical protein
VVVRDALGLDLLDPGVLGRERIDIELLPVAAGVQVRAVIEDRE